MLGRYPLRLTGLNSGSACMVDVPLPLTFYNKH